MVSVTEFQKYMSHIEAQRAKDDILSDTLVSEDTTGWVSTAPYLIDDVIDLMSNTFADPESAKEFIGWWLWEMDDNRTNNNIWSEFNGTHYKFIINDTEDLYYCITGELDKIKEKVEEEAPKEPVYQTSNVSYDEFQDMLKEAMGNKE